MTQTVYTPQRPLDLVPAFTERAAVPQTGRDFQTLRYQPPDAGYPFRTGAEIPCQLISAWIDESIEELPEDFTADLVAMTVITGNARRAPKQLAAQMRAEKYPVVLGGRMSHCCRRSCCSIADTVCTGYSRQSWPQLSVILWRE